jgi:hypothetical protein
MWEQHTLFQPLWYVCTFIHIFIYIYKYICIYIYIYLCVSIYIYTSIYMYTYKHMYIYTYIYTYIYIYLHICIHINMYLHTYFLTNTSERAIHCWILSNEIHNFCLYTYTNMWIYRTIWTDTRAKNSRFLPM